ncbi:MAG: hypothetical protein MUC43_08340, partial [Pirellula sp.]|nr:hypothetical protein [Pirellula sp.]
RRLASLGNYAPLGGLFLGLIGSGIIVWARRKRSDAYMMGAIGAVCSTVFGIGGYSILEFMDSQADTEMVANEIATPPAVHSIPSNNGAALASSATYTVGNEGFVATGPDRSAVPGTPSGDQSPSAPLQSSPPNANAPSSSAWQENKARRNDASKFEQDMETSFVLSRTYSEGFTDVSLFDSQRGGDPKLLNMVGSESPHSCLFTRRAVKGVCGFAMGTVIQLVPITRVTEKMKGAVLASDQEELYGLRFAFDGSRIVGYQGLLNSKESSSPKETEWFGRKTDSVKESLNPKPGKTGFMCFQNGADFVGFGWVML